MIYYNIHITKMQEESRDDCPGMLRILAGNLFGYHYEPTVGVYDVVIAGGQG